MRKKFFFYQASTCTWKARVVFTAETLQKKKLKAVQTERKINIRFSWNFLWLKKASLCAVVAFISLFDASSFNEMSLKIHHEKSIVARDSTRMCNNVAFRILSFSECDIHTFYFFYCVNVIIWGLSCYKLCKTTKKILESHTIW